MLEKVGIFVVLGSLFSLALWPQEVRNADSPRTIRVTGSAEVEYPPNIIRIQVGVVRRGAEPVSVQQEVRRAATEVLATIADLGIEDRQISTDHISLEERNWDPEDWDSEDCPILDRNPFFEGSMDIFVTLEDFSRYDALLSGLFSSGSNRLHRVSFDSTLRFEKNREARLLAVKAARDKATEVVAVLGQTLGPPLEINVDSSGLSSRFSTSNTYVVDGLNRIDFGELQSLRAGDLTSRGEVSIEFAIEDPITKLEP